MLNQMKTWWIFSAWGLTLAFGLFCAAIILAANFQIGRPVFVAVHSIPFGDKIAHFLLVGVLAVVLNMAMNAATVRLGPVVLLRGNLILYLLATAEELSNALQPYRSLSLTDMVFNWLGIFAFGWIAVILHKRAQ